MQIKTFVLSEYMSNCYLLYRNQEAIIIDPGAESQVVVDFIKEKQLTVKAIYATHGHIDHVGGIRFLKNRFKCPTYAPKKDHVWFHETPYNRLGYQIPIDHFVGEGDTLTLDNDVFTIYETPGHSEGGTVLYQPNLNICFSGDTLFRRSVGRTDLPFGNFQQLEQSILKMYRLFPEDTIVYPGHGPTTTIGDEKRQNPFVHMIGA